MAGRNQRIGVADGQTVREARVRCRADARSGARGDELFVDYAGDTVPVIIDRLTDLSVLAWAILTSGNRPALVA